MESGILHLTRTPNGRPQALSSGLLPSTFPLAPRPRLAASTRLGSFVQSGIGDRLIAPALGSGERLLLHFGAVDYEPKFG